MVGGTDSKLVVLAFQSGSIVPWQLRQRWKYCLFTIQSMDFVVSHIFREGNHCADKLANLGISLIDLVWLNDVHNSIIDDFAKNKLGLPCFRIVS